jgi:hypothetical protein
MQRLPRTSLLVLIILAAVTACIMPTVSWTDPLLQATLQALTIEAAIRGTQTAGFSPSPGPSPTASQIPSPTLTLVASLTPTASMTPTPIVIASPTSLVPMISVSVPTNCRVGPGKPYSIAGALLVGEVAQVYGRDPTGHYWYIENPDSPGEFCYVTDEYATFYGYTGSVPMFTPPPTPTPTFTPTPVPSFEATFEGSVFCTGSWWAIVALENTGSLAFRSIEFTIRDLDLDTVASDEDDGFHNKPDCSSTTSKNTLEPDKTVLVSSPALDNNAEGHRVRARITLCSKTGQEGQCVTNTITFRP